MEREIILEGIVDKMLNELFNSDLLEGDEEWDMNGRKGKNICLVANVQRVSNHKINKANSKQRGRVMSFLTIEDATCSLDSVVVFPDVRDVYHFILYEGNNLMLCGEVDKDNSFIVEKIHEI